MSRAVPTPEEALDGWAIDLVQAPLRRERRAYMVAAAGLVVGLAGLGSAMALLPLKEVQTHVVVVDQATGEMDRVVQVEALTLDEEDAVVQALLVSYVDDRETYDLADGDARINAVLDRSDGDAARTLRTLWSPGHDDYPLDVYGPDARIDVRVRTVTPIEPGVAQVRFTRTLRNEGDDREVTQASTATVAYEFRPGVERTLEGVWANPLGFVVTGYRVDAETLEG